MFSSHSNHLLLRAVVTSWVVTQFVYLLLLVVECGFLPNGQSMSVMVLSEEVKRHPFPFLVQQDNVPTD